MQFILTLLTLCQLALALNGLKILVVSSGVVKSLLLFNDRLTKVLLSEGHEVHQLINYSLDRVPLEPDVNVATLTEYYPTEQFPDWITATKSLNKLMAKYAFDDLGLTDMAAGLRASRTDLYYQCKQLMGISKNGSMLEKYKKMNFDVMLGHVYLNMLPVFADQLKVPLILVSGGNYIIEENAYRFSLPMTASYIPVYVSSCSDKMVFRERMATLVVYSLFTIYESISTFGQMSEKRCCDENIATQFNFRQILRDKPEQLLLNGERIIDFPRPIGSFVHHIGELTPKTYGKPLRSNWVEFVSGATDGIILFILGSSIDSSMMPKLWKIAFLKAFAQFPTYRIIWKCDTEIPEADKYPHIRLSSWVPQRQLLAHENMKLFISHGGYNSLVEACHCGIPFLMIPLCMDQYSNAQRAARLGFARILNKMELTEDTIAMEMKTVLGNEKFKERSSFMSRIIGEHISSTRTIEATFGRQLANMVNERANRTRKIDYPLTVQK